MANIKMFLSVISDIAWKTHVVVSAKFFLPLITYLLPLYFYTLEHKTINAHDRTAKKMMRPIKIISIMAISPVELLLSLTSLLILAN